MKLSEADFLAARILVVDDQESNVQLLVQMLKDVGYTSVDATRDPQEVFGLHRRNPYDLILLELQMPGMDGFQVIEGLKTNSADGYLPVLVITAQPGHKLRALQAGVRDFISKPFDLVEAKARIHNMLEVRLLYRCYCHRWQKGDMVIRNDGALLHLAQHYAAYSVRLMHTTTIMG